MNVKGPFEGGFSLLIDNFVGQSIPEEEITLWASKSALRKFCDRGLKIF